MSDDDRSGKLAAELRVKADNFERGGNPPGVAGTPEAIYRVGAAIVELLGAIHRTLRVRL